MMKTLQKKILVLVISSILISALVVMVIAFFYFSRMVERNSGQIMQLMCSDNRQEIDEKLLNIEQGGHTLYHYVMGQISESENLWQDEEQYAEHISRMKSLIEIIAKYTDGAVSVYYRLDTGIKGAKQGVWLLQDENGEFTEQEMTDLSSYDKDDIERVGWYYIPIANGKETWMNPYYNQNMDREIISYVIPVIIDNRVIGVVGMDIATELLYENTKSVTVYENGYAFLMDNQGNFVYHPEMKANEITAEFNSQHAYLYEKSMISAENQSVEDYRWNDVNKKMASQKLRNGMIFSVCVTEQEIKSPQQKLLSDSIVVIFLVILAFVAVTVSITKVIVKLIYTDAMTHVGNKTAYMECIDEIYKRIENKEKLTFTVIVIDINNLKNVNDTYGHEYGDELIQNSVAIMKKVWGNKFLYRIGGDEFAIVRFGMNEEAAQEMILLFEKALADFNFQHNGENYYLQMAIGMAVYNPEIDKGYMEVFRRADSAMYEDKKRKKNKGDRYYAGNCSR